MPLGIRPTIDFVFRLLYGTEGNVDLLVDLANAVVRREPPIDAVELLSPFYVQEFESSKLTIVDVKARERLGSFLVVEMQTTVPGDLKNRNVYYSCVAYSDQLGPGMKYADLKPVISIWLLTKPLFRDPADAGVGHFCFQLYDIDHERLFGDQMQIHVVEFPKYDLTEEQLSRATRLEQWVFFFTRAADYEADELRRLLPDPVFQKAIGVLEMIAQSPELRRMYEERQKAELDRFSELHDAKNEGRIEGKAEGRVEGKAEGRIEGKVEGESRGRFMGRIALLRSLLGETPLSDAEFATAGLTDLERMELQLRERWNSKN